MKKTSGHTPLIQQYLDIKSEHQDSILFFRLGDFYEMFFDDAKKAAPVLDIALTTRDKNSKNPVPLCGVPYHSSNSYISKLLDANYKVAICEQVEEASATKGIVKREVVKVITPGMQTDQEGLHLEATNALVSIVCDEQKYAVSWIDVSTGEFWISVFETLQRLVDEVSRLGPKEVLISEDQNFLIEEFEKKKIVSSKIQFERVPEWVFSNAQQDLMNRFKVKSLEGLGLSDPFIQSKVAYMLIYYVEVLNKSAMEHLQEPRVYKTSNFLEMDVSTRKNLSLIGTREEISSGKTLFSVLNQTSTRMGYRKLRSWISFPLKKRKEIESRQNSVEYLLNDNGLRTSLQAQLKQIYDLERLLGRIVSQNGNARDLVNLKQSLLHTSAIKEFGEEVENLELRSIFHQIETHQNLIDKIQNAIQDEPPISKKEGKMIRPGYHEELDELLLVDSESNQWLIDFEKKERERTGISNLKVRYNRVFGYFIEVTKSHLNKVPIEYTRKQTLTNAERFITSALKERETLVLSAKERISALELSLFEEVREYVSSHVSGLQRLSDLISDLDVICSLSQISLENEYVKPIFTDEALHIKNGRHPVVEKFMADQQFVPNDASMDHHSNQLLVLTGPNMAGKSTVMRQIAMIAIMAQIGCFVPADFAELPLFDQIFTRVGASDDLATGRSTFMVEMTETANILRNATKSSLVLLDEIGRGTSTFDGLSIAWAVAEYLHDEIGCKTIFATHYHELTELALTKEKVKNMNISVKEWQGEIVFLRKLVEGAASQSYGLEVARLAGVVPKVIARARKVLSNLENSELDALGAPKISAEESNTLELEHKRNQFELFRKMSDDFWEEFQNIDADNLTPKQAHDLLYEWRKRYKIKYGA